MASGGTYFRRMLNRQALVQSRPTTVIAFSVLSGGCYLIYDYFAGKEMKKIWNTPNYYAPVKPEITYSAFHQAAYDEDMAGTGRRTMIEAKFFFPFLSPTPDDIDKDGNISAEFLQRNEEHGRIYDARYGKSGSWQAVQSTNL
mmetsp:Transcript_10177/g.14811  ORF Transcript_10177/g.14811 Transcript_10177/m.14811 type:complete len:143 (-) Transcript_10177:42-470(-)|eukprot:CAMPEP_0175089558 /NCGR_PEP_ID=MMETSP0086_2-20121207/849_1 /TAXON_ID=136419 /ORGANISM="Unknown Unknown, Strain D1" /LENGTH=142 /DNA_ID=CAMNT_0016362073 /DNA_START=80 /DNA_END=508 /DNA_ORIENTATION=+